MVLPENFYAISMDVEGGDMVKEPRAFVDWPWLGPWISTSRI